MNILIVSEGFPPQIGGLEKVVYELALGLKEKGNSITVITTTKEREKRCELIDGIKVHYCPMNIRVGKINFFVEMIDTVKELRGVLKQVCPDVVSVQYLGYLSLIFLFANPGLNIPYLISIHGSDVVSPGKNFSYVKKKVMRNVISGAQAVISNSNYLGKKAEELLDIDLSDKLYVIWNGIHLKNYLPIEPCQKSKNVIGIGRFAYKKGFDVLIRSFAIVKKQVPESKLILVGDGSERPTCEQLVKQLALDDSISFLGYVDNNKIRSSFQMGNVFVLPSRNEPFGVVALEAMAFGLPSVITASGGVTEIIKDGENGFVVPVDDEKTMAERIIQLLTEQELSKAFREKGFKRVRNFTCEKVVEQYEEVLHKACDYHIDRLSI